MASSSSSFLCFNSIWIFIAIRFQFFSEFIVKKLFSARQRRTEAFFSISFLAFIRNDVYCRRKALSVNKFLLYVIFVFSSLEKNFELIFVHFYSFFIPLPIRNAYKSCECSITWHCIDKKLFYRHSIHPIHHCRTIQSSQFDSEYISKPPHTQFDVWRIQFDYISSFIELMPSHIMKMLELNNIYQTQTNVWEAHEGAIRNSAKPAEKLAVKFLA